MNKKAQNPESGVEVIGTAIAVLPPTERAAIALSAGQTETNLRAMAVASAKITDIKDAAGREEAHRTGMTLKNARITIEKTGKAAREDATAFSSAVITEERRLNSIISAEETRVFALRDAYDAKIKADKEAKERAAEIERQRIDNEIGEIRFTVVYASGKTAVEVQTLIDQLDDRVIAEATFGERLPEAVLAKNTAMSRLREMLAAAIERETEAIRLQAQLEENERVRQEQEAAAEKLRQGQEDLARQQRELAMQQAAAKFGVPANVLDAMFKQESADGGGEPRGLFRFPESALPADDDSDPFPLADRDDSRVAIGVDIPPAWGGPEADPVLGALAAIDDQTEPPTLAELVEVIADEFDVSDEQAEQWLRDAVAEA